MIPQGEVIVRWDVTKWAWEDLNFRPHAYQAFEFRPKSRHFAVISTMDHVICRHLDPKCRTLPSFIDTMPTFCLISLSPGHEHELYLHIQPRRPR